MAAKRRKPERVLFHDHFRVQEVRTPAEEKPEQLYLRITKHGKEVVYWDSDEWQQDPFVLLSILSAIKMVTEGMDVRSHLEEMSHGM